MFSSDYSLCRSSSPVSSLVIIIISLLLLLALLLSSTAAPYFVSGQIVQLQYVNCNSGPSDERLIDKTYHVVTIDRSFACDFAIRNLRAHRIRFTGNHIGSNFTIENVTCLTNTGILTAVISSCIEFSGQLTNTRSIVINNVKFENNLPSISISRPKTAITFETEILFETSSSTSGLSISNVELSNAECSTAIDDGFLPASPPCYFYGVHFQSVVSNFRFFNISNIVMKNLTLKEKPDALLVVGVLFQPGPSDTSSLSAAGIDDTTSSTFEINNIAISNIHANVHNSTEEAIAVTAVHVTKDVWNIREFSTSALSMRDVFVTASSTVGAVQLMVMTLAGAIRPSRNVEDTLRTFIVQNISLSDLNATTPSFNGSDTTSIIVTGFHAERGLLNFNSLEFIDMSIRNFTVESQTHGISVIALSFVSFFTGLPAEPSSKFVVDNVAIESGTVEVSQFALVLGVNHQEGAIIRFSNISFSHVRLRKLTLEVTDENSERGSAFVRSIDCGRDLTGSTQVEGTSFSVQHFLIADIQIRTPKIIRLEGARFDQDLGSFTTYFFSNFTIKNTNLISSIVSHSDYSSGTTSRIRASGVYITRLAFADSAIAAGTEKLVADGFILKNTTATVAGKGGGGSIQIDAVWVLATERFSLSPSIGIVQYKNFHLTDLKVITTGNNVVKVLGASYRGFVIADEHSNTQSVLVENCVIENIESRSRDVDVGCFRAGSFTNISKFHFRDSVVRNVVLSNRSSSSFSSVAHPSTLLQISIASFDGDLLMTSGSGELLADNLTIQNIYGNQLYANESSTSTSFSVSCISVTGRMTASSISVNNSSIEDIVVSFIATTTSPVEIISTIVNFGSALTADEFHVTNVITRNITGNNILHQPQLSSSSSSSSSKMAIRCVFVGGSITNFGSLVFKKLEVLQLNLKDRYAEALASNNNNNNIIEVIATILEFASDMDGDGHPFTIQQTTLENIKIHTLRPGPVSVLQLRVSGDINNYNEIDFSHTTTRNVHVYGDDDDDTSSNNNAISAAVGHFFISGDVTGSFFSLSIMDSFRIAETILENINVTITPSSDNEDLFVSVLKLDGALLNYPSIRLESTEAKDLYLLCKNPPSAPRAEICLDLFRFGDQIDAEHSASSSTISSGSSFSVENLHLQNATLKGNRVSVYGVVWSSLVSRLNKVTGYRKVEFRKMQMSDIDVEGGSFRTGVNAIMLAHLRGTFTPPSSSSSSSFTFEASRIFRAKCVLNSTSECRLSALSLSANGRLEDITTVLIRDVELGNIEFSRNKNIESSSDRQALIKCIDQPEFRNSIPTGTIVVPTTPSVEISNIKVSNIIISGSTANLVAGVDFSQRTIRNYDNVSFSNFIVSHVTLNPINSANINGIAAFFAYFGGQMEGPSSLSKSSSLSFSNFSVESVFISPQQSRSQSTVHSTYLTSSIVNFETVTFSSQTVKNVRLVDDEVRDSLTVKSYTGVVQMADVRYSKTSSSTGITSTFFSTTSLTMSNISITSKSPPTSPSGASPLSLIVLEINSEVRGYQTIQFSNLSLNGLDILVNRAGGENAIDVDVYLLELAQVTSSSSSSSSIVAQDFTMNDVSLATNSSGSITISGIRTWRTVTGVDSILFSDMHQNNIRVYSSLLENKNKMEIKITSVLLEGSVFKAGQQQNNIPLATNNNNQFTAENILVDNCSIIVDETRSQEVVSTNDNDEDEYHHQISALHCWNCDVSNITSVVLRDALMTNNAAKHVSVISLFASSKDIIANRITVTSCQVVRNHSSCDENSEASSIITIITNSILNLVIESSSSSPLFNKIDLIQNLVSNLGACRRNISNHILWANLNSSSSSASSSSLINNNQQTSPLCNILNNTLHVADESQQSTSTSSSVVYAILPFSSPIRGATNETPYENLIFTTNLELNKIEITSSSQDNNNSKFDFSDHIASFSSSLLSQHQNSNTSSNSSSSSPSLLQSRLGLKLGCNFWSTRYSQLLRRTLHREFLALVSSQVTCHITETQSNSLVRSHSSSLSLSPSLSLASPSLSMSSPLTPSFDRTLTKESATESALTESSSHTHVATPSNTFEITPPPFVSPFKSIIEALTFTSLMISQLALTSSSAPMVRSIRTKNVLDLTSKIVNGNCDSTTLTQSDIEEAVLENEPDITESPFGFQLSNELGGYASGQVFGGLLWIVGCCVGFPVISYVLFIRRYNIKYTARRRKRTVHGLFPLFSEIIIESKSLHLVFFSLQMLLQPICSASATLFFVDSVSIFMKICCLIIALGVVAGIITWCYFSLFKRYRTEEFVETDTIVPAKFQKELGLFAGERSDVTDEIEKLKENNRAILNDAVNDEETEEGEDQDDEDDEAKPFFLIRGINYLNEVNGEWKHLKVKKNPTARINNVTSFYFALPLLEGYSDNAPRFAIADFAAVFMMFLTSFVGEWFVGSCIFAGVSLMVVIFVHLLISLKFSPFADRISRLMNPLFCAMEIVILAVALFGTKSGDGEDNNRENLIVIMQLVLASAQLIVSTVIGLGVVLFLYDGLQNLFKMRKKFELLEKLKWMDAKRKKKMEKLEKKEQKEKKKLQKLKRQRGGESSTPEEEEHHQERSLLQRAYTPPDITTSLDMMHANNNNNNESDDQELLTIVPKKNNIIINKKKRIVRKRVKNNGNLGIASDPMI